MQLLELPAQTTLLVSTRHSLYRIVVIDGSDVCVQGGSFFPSPMLVLLGSVSADRTLKFWDVESGQEVLSLREDGAAIFFGAGGDKFYLVGRDGVVAWDATPR